MYITWQFTYESNGATDYKTFPLTFNSVYFCIASSAPKDNLSVMGSNIAWVSIDNTARYLCGFGNNTIPATYKNLLILTIGY